MGVVVRLDATSEAVQAPVVVHLRPASGQTIDVQLKDDGVSPDVAAGDGAWSAVATLAGDSFDVSMTVGQRELPGGPVEWSAGDRHRDLALTVVNGALQATAGVAPEVIESAPATPPTSVTGIGPGGGDGAPGSPGGGDGTPGATGPSPGSGTAGGAGSPGGGAGATPGGAPEGAPSESSLYLLLGLGGLVLAGIAWMWLRGGSGGALPKGMTLSPEAPLVGPGTPSLSDGLAVWVVAPADARDFSRAMLATLARAHRVVVSAPPRAEVAPVAGGPVYRVEAGKLRTLHAALDLLAGEGQGGAALLVLDEDLDAARLTRLAEALPPGVGAVVVASAPPSGGPPVVRVARDGAGWALTVGERVIRARESASGLDPTG